MWINSNLGYLSIVQKPGERRLTLRARVASDLDRLRDLHLPSLGPTLADGGTDYPYRAHASHAAVAHALASMVQAIDYANFKSEAARTLGHPRDAAHHGMWAAARGLESLEPLEPPMHARAYGGAVLRDDGALLLRRPKGEYDGYVWTIAKGKPRPGEAPEQCALREVLDETGVVGRIVGELPGWFRSGSSATKLYVMSPVEERGRWDDETAEIAWVDLDEAESRVRQTRNQRGRQRDLSVLAAVRALRAERGSR